MQIKCASNTDKKTAKFCKNKIKDQIVKKDKSIKKKKTLYKKTNCSFHQLFKINSIREESFCSVYYTQVTKLMVYNNKFDQLKANNEKKVSQQYNLN